MKLLFSNGTNKHLLFYLAVHTDAISAGNSATSAFHKLKTQRPRSGRSWGAAMLFIFSLPVFLSFLITRSRCPHLATYLCFSFFPFCVDIKTQNKKIISGRLQRQDLVKLRKRVKLLLLLFSTYGLSNTNWCHNRTMGWGVKTCPSKCSKRKLLNYSNKSC